ncbi:MAG: hypothetical protein K2O70_03140, partial [Desulfovibrionaceae bacterium]|nr:hypothetical protein [Desulfovibrionaceae bacterium]
MRLVVDMQGAQTLSRLQGIGRFTRGLAGALAHRAGGHEVVFACNALFPDTIADMRRLGATTGASVRLWNGQEDAPFRSRGPLPHGEAEKSYAAFLNDLDPDAVLFPTLLGEWEDGFVCSIDGLRKGISTAAIVHDFIPLEPFCPDLTCADDRRTYERKLATLWRMDILLANSEYTRKAAERLHPGSRIVAVGADVEPCFHPMTLSSGE